MPKKPILPLPEDVAELPTKSARIRELRHRKWDIGDIARTVGVQYQFAYNVLSRPLKREIKRLRDEARAKALQEREQQEKGK